VCGGTFEKYIAELAAMEYCSEVKDLVAMLAEGTEQLKKGAVFVKDAGIEYMDLYGRGLVDIAMDLIVGYLFCGQASSKVDMEAAVAGDEHNDQAKTVRMTERKAVVARRWITRNVPKITAIIERTCGGDKTTFGEYGALVGPVPEEL
jgi:hypothetical protein